MLNTQYVNNAISGMPNMAVPQPPPPQPLGERLAMLTSSLDDLNNNLASLRARIFGEAENPPAAAGLINGPAPSMASCISMAEDLLNTARSQVSSILNRI